MTPKSRKPLSRSRSRATSRKVRNSTIGTHVTRTSKRSVSSSEPSFASPRKAKRAQRGVVDQVLPNTSSRESRNDYLKRTQKNSVSEDVKKKRTLRTVLVAVVVVLVAIGLVGLIGSTVFYGTASSRMAFNDSGTTGALVDPTSGEPYYVLVAGEHYESSQDYLGPGLLILARVDEQEKTLSLMNIPYNVRLVLDDRKYHGIAEAQVMGDDEYLISTVADFAGVSISHYLKVGSDDFVSLVDELGGVEVMVNEEVDDPQAGVEYIAAGLHALSGKEALTFVRASNYTNGVETQMENHSALLLSLASKLTESSGFGRMSLIEALSNHIKTDYSSRDISGLADAFKGFDVDAVEIGKVPGFAGTDDSTGQQFYYYSSDTWTALMEAMEAGTSFEAIDPVVVVDPASFTITVRNGSGLTGGAQQITAILTEAGYRVEETGNADSYVYDETLVVYDDNDNRSAAQAVVEELGVGRAVAANGFYTFETDVLVVFGTDWKPMN